MCSAGRYWDGILAWIFLPPIEHEGPQVRQLRRLVAIAAGIAALILIPILDGAIEMITEPVDKTRYLLLLSVLILPPIVGGVSAWFARHDDTPIADKGARMAMIAELAVFAILCACMRLFSVAVIRGGMGDVYSEAGVLANYMLLLALVASSVLRPRAAYAYIVIVGPILVLAYPPGVGMGARLEEMLVYQTSTAAELAPLLWLLVQARLLDAASLEERELLVDLKVQQALARVRNNSNNLIHDCILSVLKVVSTVESNSPDVRDAARGAISAIEEAARPCPKSCGEFVDALTKNMGDLPHGRMRLLKEVEDDAQLPPEVAENLLGATLEAVKNSLAHASRGSGERHSSLTLSIRGDAGGLRIVVADDGCGFDPSRVAFDRFGVRSSIIEAVRRVGGEAEIASSPGAGTTIVLEWRSDRHLSAGSDRKIRLASISPLTIESCLESPVARIVAAGFCLSYFFVVAHEIMSGSYRNGSLVVAALALDMLAAALLVHRWAGSRLPDGIGVLVVVLGVGAHALTMSLIAFEGWPGYASWSFGVATTLACCLLVRRRPGFAWALLLLLSFVTFFWACVTGNGLWTPMLLLIGQFVILCIWHLMVAVSLRLTARTARAQSASAAISARWRAQRESQDLLRAVMDSVRTRTAPILNEIAEGAALTEELRVRARLLEAELRDERRAPFFSGTSVVDEARSARERGVDVMLLDDRGPEPLSPRLGDAVIEATRAALAHACRGRAVIRLLPPNRFPDLLTISTDGDIRILCAETGRSARRDWANSTARSGTLQ